MNTIFKSHAVLIIIFLLFGCQNNEIKKQFESIDNGKTIAKGINILLPHNNTIFPPEFPSPTFEWTDTTAQSDEWYVFLSNNEGKILIKDKIEKNSWKPDSSSWEDLKKFSTLGSYSFTIVANNNKNQYSPSGRINFTISKDSVGAEIFFRAVTLPFSYAVKNVHTIEWYLGSVKGGRPKKMLDNLPVCGNCHSFSKEKPLLAMDVDYGNDKGSYAISDAKDTCLLTPENIISWSDYKKEEGDPTFGLLSQISPDGNYVLSTIKDLSVFVAVDNNLAYSQLFFPIKGIIGIYDRKTKTFSELTGANDRKYVQSNPSWSPDSKKIVFARTEAYVSERVKKAGRALLHIDDIKEFSSGQKQFKYDLCQIGFNDGKGGTASFIQGASNNGKSNYFPKFSPNGKWIVFCQAENFMLLQRDSRLFIMPANGGQPREMNCNMKGMNSWHSWSPNSKWIVFSSKNRGLYTQLYLTHIDENGMDSPPVLIENLCFEKRADNIPEFFPGNANDFKSIKDAFSNTAPYFFQMATDNMDNKYYKRALANLSKSIAIDSNLLEAYIQRIILNGILKQSNSVSDRYDKLKAKKIVDSLLLHHPENENLMLLNATICSILGQTDQALKQAINILYKNEKNYKTYELMCSIYRKTKQNDKIFPIYYKMLTLFPSDAPQINNLIAALYEETEQYNQALLILNRLITNHPYDLNIRASRAGIYIKTKNYAKAKQDLDHILTKDTSNYKCNLLMHNYYLNTNKDLEANYEIREAFALIDREINANNENIELLFEKANILAGLNKIREAEIVYSTILEVLPLNYEALKEKARIMISNKQWDEAISLYNKLANNYLPEEEFYNNCAIAYIQNGNFNQAMFQFNKTIELNPYNYDARYNRSKLYLMLGDKIKSDEEKKKLKSDLIKKQQTYKLNKSEEELLNLL
jgi:tetratricopeptide (TPR) repeat protein